MTFDVAGFAEEIVSSAVGHPVDRVHACALFKSEALFTPIGWTLPPVWDPIAGDYRARDRFLRIHTNYAHHRAAALRVLGCEPTRDAVGAAIAKWDAIDLEGAIVDAGGCAAVMYTRDEWLATAHGEATKDEPHVTVTEHDVERPRRERLRVVDLTRVIAGPVCTQVLAARGMEVVRIDPPGFDEVPVIEPAINHGKQRLALALTKAPERARFMELVRDADVVVHGLRPGALSRLGMSNDELREVNPALIIATLDAYGWRGPWRERRGFDSLVQMSVGIAAHAGVDRPRPLPAQALDHSTGWVLAREVLGAIARGKAATIRASLLGAANALFARGEASEAFPTQWPDAIFESARTPNGDARRVRLPS